MLATAFIAPDFPAPPEFGGGFGFFPPPGAFEPPAPGAIFDAFFGNPTGVSKLAFVPNSFFGGGLETVEVVLEMLEAALLHWNHVYEAVRPHQALGYKTLEQLCQDWLTLHSPRKEA